MTRQSASIALSALVIAAVILLNVLVTFLCSANLWFADMTSGHFREADISLYAGMYTLSDSAENLMKQTFDAANENRAEGEEVKVDIIFCADPDLLCGSTYMRYIYYTALEMQKAFPDSIRVSTKDVWSNPSSVNAYRTNSYSSIYQTNVIVASGSEYRVYSQRAFYTYSETTDTVPWAYSGEKTFLKGIIAVTKADSPIACLTTNHGEPFATEEGRAEYSAFLNVLKASGYEVRFLDLEKEEIPENCRLIVTFDPQTDYLSGFGSGADTISETKKLDAYLANAYSFMIFVDADTPKLANLEEYLVKWGVSFKRGEDGNGMVYDSANALDGAGTSFVGTYENEALGGSITSDMRKYGVAPKIVFSNAMSIEYSSSYKMAYELADETAGTGAFSYGYYSSNKASREIFDVFRASETALLYSKQDGVMASTPLDTTGNFKVMTLSRESRYIGEGQGYTSVNDASYVCAVGSTEFASNAVLNSNAYGNTDLLLEVLRLIGREIEPVGIKFKPMYSSAATEQYVLEEQPAKKTAVLVALPLVACALSGIVVLVRRKTRR